MPDYSSLSKAYPYRTELHAHTFPVSSCSFVTAAETVRRYRDVGCDSLVIVNHLSPPKWIPGNTAELAELYLSDYEAAKKAAGNDINVILGVEIRFHGIENFYKKAKTPRNVILQAHPFRKEMVRAPLDCIDGIEIFNMHPKHNSAVALAARYAKEHGLLVCGGSDFHYENDEALCLVRTENKLRDSYDVADMIRSKNFLFDISGNLILPYQN